MDPSTSALGNSSTRKRRLPTRFVESQDETRAPRTNTKPKAKSSSKRARRSSEATSDIPPRKRSNKVRQRLASNRVTAVAVNLINGIDEMDSQSQGTQPCRQSLPQFALSPVTPPQSAQRVPIPTPEPIIPLLKYTMTGILLIKPSTKLFTTMTECELSEGGKLNDIDCMSAASQMLTTLRSHIDERHQKKERLALEVEVLHERQAKGFSYAVSLDDQQESSYIHSQWGTAAAKLWMFSSSNKRLMIRLSLLVEKKAPLPRTPVSSSRRTPTARQFKVDLRA